MDHFSQFHSHGIKKKTCQFYSVRWLHLKAHSDVTVGVLTQERARRAGGLHGYCRNVWDCCPHFCAAAGRAGKPEAVAAGWTISCKASTITRTEQEWGSLSMETCLGLLCNYSVWQPGPPAQRSQQEVVPVDSGRASCSPGRFQEVALTQLQLLQGKRTFPPSPSRARTSSWSQAPVTH